MVEIAPVGGDAGARGRSMPWPWGRGAVGHGAIPSHGDFVEKYGNMT